MGYLDNSSVTVDAVLTKRGRELLAKGEFDITHFALSDDEIDYSLWDVGHNNGSNFYGEAIENLPMLEAFTNDPQALKYKLITLPKNTQILPVITLAQSSVVLTLPGQSSIIAPQTANVTDGNQSSGYTYTVSNADIVTLSAEQLQGQSSLARANQVHVPDGNQSSHTITALTARLTARSIATTTSTTLTITANETGGTITVPITINADTNLTTGQL